MKKRLKHYVKKILPTLKPTAICIGAQKAGTTALYKYLSLHPQIAPPKIKELNFFGCDKRFNKGIKQYHQYYPKRTLNNLGKTSIDVTPDYLPSAEISAPRIYKYNKEIRLIVLLRNPVERAFSAWQMYRKRDREWFFKWVRNCNDKFDKEQIQLRSSFGKDFISDIRDEIDAINQGQQIELPILSLGMYHKYLKYYFSLFNPEQILAIESNELKNYPKETLKKVEDHIGLTNFDWPEELLIAHYKGEYKESIHEDALKILMDFYQLENQKLFKLLNVDYKWNSDLVEKYNL